MAYHLTDGQIVYVNHKHCVVWLFDADDCEGIASYMGTDSWRDELLDAAERLRQLE